MSPSRRSLPAKAGGFLEAATGSDVSVSVAAQMIGCSPDTVLRLIEEGAFEAWRLSARGWFRIKRESLRLYLQRKNGGPESATSVERTLAAREANIGTVAIPPPSAAATRPGSPESCPSNACSAHWERLGQIVPMFRAGLCRACFSGSLPVKPTLEA